MAGFSSLISSFASHLQPPLLINLFKCALSCAFFFCQLCCAINNSHNISQINKEYEYGERERENWIDGVMRSGVKLLVNEREFHPLWYLFFCFLSFFSRLIIIFETTRPKTPAFVYISRLFVIVSSSSSSAHVVVVFYVIFNSLIPCQRHYFPPFSVSSDEKKARKTDDFFSFHKIFI